MKGLRKMQIMGNLTKNPELEEKGVKKTPVVNFTVAVNCNKEETIYVDCEAWSRIAQILDEYLYKGDAVFLEGKFLEPYAYISRKNNKPGAKLKMRVEAFRFIGRSNGKHESEK
ncbi:MAG: single-stranded DNA-binding protein [bacterium]